MSWKFGCLFWLVVVILAPSACHNRREEPVAVYTVKHGEFVNSVTVTGDLDAVNSQVIVAPFLSWSMGIPKIARIVEDGKRVEAGELLVQFDQAEVEKGITDAKAELEIAEAELTKARVNHESDMGDLTADLEIAGLGHKISGLKLEKAAFEAEIDRKKIELDLEKAAIQLDQAKQEIENRKKVQQEEINKLELKVRQARTKLDQARETLASLTIKAPIPGIAIIRESWMTDNKFQVDDQAYPGWPLIGLPDLSAMKAEVEINEVDIAKIDTGQTVRVRLDAYPDTSFHGRVTEIATLARQKTRRSKVKVFDATVLLAESAEKLMPGMTVSCEIFIDRFADTLFIPLEALFKRDGESIVYLQNGSGFEARAVVPGLASDNYVIVSEGLKEGDKVALADPTARRVKPEKAETAAGEKGKR